MKKFYLLMVCSFCWLFSLQAQEAESSFMKDTDSYNFYDIQKKAEKFFKEDAKEKKKAARQAGAVMSQERTYVDDEYVKFKRWEWYWRDRILPDGSFPNLNQQFDTYQQLQKRTAGARTTALTPSWKNINFTQNTGGYNGMGRVVSIGFHPTDPNTYYAGGARGGIWKTTDGGQSYTPLGENLAFLAVGNILVDPVNPNTIYISIGDRTFWNQTVGLGVYKSTDGGQSWNQTGLRFTPTDNIYFYRMEMSPVNPSVILLSTNKGLLRTGDGGATWQSVSEGIHQDIRFQPETNTVYVGKTQPATTYTQLFRSTDGGITWKQATNFKIKSNTIKMAFSKANPNYLAVLCDHEGLRDIYVSTDNGQTFALKSTIPVSTVVFYVSQLNTDIMYAADVEMYRSLDGGLTWKQITRYCCPTADVVEIHADFHILSASPLDPATFFAGNDGGVYTYHEPSNTWTERNNGLVISQFYDIAVAQTHPTILTGGTQDNGSFIRRASEQWQSTNGGDGMMQAIDYTNPDIMYTTYINGTLYRSMDGWRSDVYREISPLVNGARLRGEWVAPYLLDPNNPSVLIAGYNDVYRSINRGDSWTRISTNLAGGNVQNLAMTPVNSSIIYASRDNRLYRTTNLGTTWTSATVPSNGNRITKIAVDAGNADRVWVTVASYTDGMKVLRSDNGGVSWTNVTGSLPNVVANSVIFEAGSNGRIYVATDGGVFYRDNTTTDWVYYGKGMPNTSITDLEIQYATRTLRAGTYGRGIFEIGLPEVTGCGTPANLAVLSITDQRARISWSPVANASRYSIAIRPEGATDWTLLADSVGTNAYQLTGLTAATRYQVQVSSICLDGPAPSVFSFTTLLAPAPCSIAPNASMTAVANTTAALKWDVVSGAVKYSLSVRKTDDTSWTLISDSLATTTYVLSALAQNTDYVASLSATCASGLKTTALIPFKTLNANCVVPPKVVVAALTNTAVAIKWDNQPDALTYSVWIKTDATVLRQLVSGLTTTSYTISDLLPLTNYTVEVRVTCVNAEVKSTQVSAVTKATKTICGRPENMAAASVRATTATLVWTSSTAIGSYTIYVQGENDWELNDLYIDGKKGTYTLTGLKPDTKYLVKLEAVCLSGTRISSSIILRTLPVSNACEAPQILELDLITDKSATLTWLKQPRDDNYYIWLLPEGGSWTLATSNYKANSYTFTNLIPGKKYTADLYVNCTSGGNRVTRTTFTTLSTPPTPTCAGPVGLTATNLTETAVTVQWTPSAGATYQAYYTKTSARNWIKLAENTTQASVELSALDANTAYMVRVWTQCTDGSYKYSTVNFTTKALCRAPENLTAQQVTGSTALLKWTGSPGAVGFYIWVLKEGGTWVLVERNLPATTNTYTLTNLLPNTNYTVDIGSYCGTELNQSSRVRFKTTNELVGCLAPRNATATNLTTTAATLNWGGSPSSTIFYIWVLREGGEWQLAVDQLGAATTSYTLTNLVSNTNYTADIWTYCAAGNEYKSSRVTFKTASGLSAPDNVSITDLTPTTASLNWNTVATASSYSVWYRESDQETAAWKVAANELLTPAYTLVGLEPGHTYTVQVRSQLAGAYEQASVSVSTLTASSEALAAQGSAATDAFALFPMPVSTEVKIQLAATRSGTLPVILYNLAGQELHSWTKNFSLGQSTLVLPSELASGMYLLKVGTQFKKMEIKR